MSHLIRKSVQAMKGYVPGEQPKDADLVKLNTNENPYLPSPDVQDILSMIDISVLSRYPDPVCIELRKAIAELHGCEIENIFVGNGSDEVLALSIRSFVERDGSVGYFDPSYSLYPILSDIEDIEKKPISLDAGFGWQMPDDYSASLFFLTNPNAPTSFVYDQETVENFVQNFDGVTLIDEALTPDSSRFWPAGSYQAGQEPESWDKQILRNHLETLDWNHEYPPPRLPEEVLNRTYQRYREVLDILFPGEAAKWQKYL